MIFIETITPRESSDDTGNNKIHEDGTSASQAKVNKARKDLNDMQSDENVQEKENRSSVVVSADDEEAGAFGGDEDDSVFVDDAIPSTSKEMDTIAQSQPFRSSIDNTSSI